MPLIACGQGQNIISAVQIKFLILLAFFDRGCNIWVKIHILTTEKKWVRAFTPGLFVDYGMTFANSALGTDDILSGGGVKLGFKYWIIDASASWAAVIASEDWMSEDNPFICILDYLVVSRRFDSPIFIKNFVAVF